MIFKKVVVIKAINKRRKISNQILQKLKHNQIQRMKNLERIKIKRRAIYKVVLFQKTSKKIIISLSP